MTLIAPVVTAQVPPGCGGQGGVQMLMIMLMLGVFYFILIRPAQKRERQRKQMLDSIKKGDLIVTTGGLLGRVSGLTDQVVTLDVAEKIRLRVLRSHVAGKQGADIPPPQESQT